MRPPLNRAAVRLSVLAALALAAGCVTDPFAGLAGPSPAFTPAQEAELARRAATPASLGIELQSQDGGFTLGNVNVFDGTNTVTLPLAVVPGPNPKEPGGRHRVPVVTVKVNDRAGIDVVLDSGSNRPLVGYQLAQRTGVPRLRDIPVVHSQGIGGVVDCYVGIFKELKFGALALRNAVTIIAPDVETTRVVPGLVGRRDAVILGFNVLRPLSYVSIDNLKGLVTISRLEDYRPARDRVARTVVPLRWEGDLPVVDALIDGRQPFRCVLDTGGDYGIRLPRNDAARLGYWNPQSGQVGAAQGVGGGSLIATFNVRSLAISNATFQAVPGQTDVAGPVPAGGQVLIGNVLLRRHRVTFDFKHGALWLER